MCSITMWLGSFSVLEKFPSSHCARRAICPLSSSTSVPALFCRCLCGCSCGQFCSCSGTSIMVASHFPLLIFGVFRILFEFPDVPFYGELCYSSAMLHFVLDTFYLLLYASFMCRLYFLLCSWPIFCCAVVFSCLYSLFCISGASFLSPLLVLLCIVLFCVCSMFCQDSVRSPCALCLYSTADVS